MNTVKLFGRIGNKLEIKGEDSKKRINFLLAVKKNDEEVNWIRCIAFGKTADVLYKYCQKGDRIIIEGHIQSNFYGEEKTNLSMNVVVETMHFIEFKDKENTEDEDQEVF